MSKAAMGKVRGFLTVRRPDGTLKARIPFEGEAKLNLPAPPSSEQKPKEQVK